MGRLKVTRDNLAEVLDSTLDRCRSGLENASRAHVREFRIAIQALEGIQRELRDGAPRSTGVRSGAFTHYVLDEEPKLAMDPGLRDTIKEIEAVHRRF